MTHPLPTPAQFALREFENRQRTAQRRADGGIWSRLEADARLKPWLAIALHAGAEPEAAQPLLEDWRRILAHTCVNGDARTPPTAHAIRTNAAMDLCETAAWRAELAHARDRAMAAALADPANTALGTRSLLLTVLSQHLGVGLNQPDTTTERKAA